MKTAGVIGLFAVTWLLIGLVHFTRLEQAPAREMPRGSVEKEFNGLKYYLVPVRAH
jgi:hypothetical protein